jgi:hypothetical protein
VKVPSVRNPFVLDKRVTLGEAITITSILFSAISVIYTWRYEQRLQLLENATRTRVEIAKTLNSVNQVVQIQLSFYEMMEEDLVEVSRIALIDRDRERARDYMWEKCYEHKGEIFKIVSQSDWEVAYTNLLTYGISADSIYVKAINRLKGLQENQFDLLVHDLQSEILSFVPSEKNATAELTDRLRAIKADYLINHKSLTKRATAELTDFCLKRIKATDKHLVFSTDSL